MGNQNIHSIFIKYAIPTIIGMLIVSFQCIIDGIFVSQGVGPQGLAAVNITMPLTNLFFSVAIMIVSGGVVICGVAQGKGDKRLTEGYTTLTLTTLIITCIVMSIVIMTNLRRVCYLLGCDEMMYPYVREYLSVFAMTIFFYVSPCFTEAFARLYHKPNWVFVSGCVSCLTNILLDWLFVLEWGMGMRGAAIATVLADTTAALVLIRHVRLGRIAGSWADIRRIFFNGSSEMITFIATAVTTYVLNLLLMRHVGYLGVAALTIVFYFSMMVNFSTTGMAQAMYPLIAYNVGAMDYANIHKLLNIALRYSFIIGLGAFIVLHLFKRPIVGLFTNGNEELADITRYAMNYMTPAYLISFVNIIGSGFHTAIEKPVESALIASCKSLIFVLIPLMTLPPLFEHIGWNYHCGIWMSIPVGEVLCLLVTIPLMIRSMNRLKARLSTGH